MPTFGPAFDWLSRGPAPAPAPAPASSPPAPPTAVDPLAAPPGFDDVFGDFDLSWPEAPAPDLGAMAAAALAPPADELRQEGVAGPATDSLPPAPDFAGLHLEGVAGLPTDSAPPVALSPLEVASDRLDESAMAASEAFAPEYDADPAARAAEQAFEDEQARQARIDAQAAEYDRLDPLAFADMQAKRALAADHQRATEQLAAAEHDRAELEKNVKQREVARATAQRELADVTARASAMADSSPFESWWADRSTAQQFAGLIGAVFAGLGNPRGPNDAIGLFVQTAEAAAAAKWKKIEARRGLAQDALANADADFREREAIRLASYGQVQREIESRLALLDPEGTAAQRLSEVHRGVGAHIAQSMAALEEAQFERSLKTQKALDEHQKAVDEHAAAQRKLGGGGGGVGAGYGAAVTFEQMKANGWRIPAGLQPGQAMSAKAYKAFIDTEAANGRISSSDASRAQAEIERRLKLEAVTVPLPGGVAFQAKTEDEAKKARQKVFAARQLVNMIDEVLDIRDHVGGESKWANSPEYGRFQVLSANILKLTKEDTQGMSSDADMAVLKAAAGADSVASFRSQAAKLNRARDLVVAQLNGYLADGQGYAGAPVDFPNLHRTPKPKRDVAGDKMAASAPPAVAPPTGARTAREVGDLAPYLPPGVAGEALKDAPDPLFDPAGARGVSEQQNEGIEALVQGALTGDEAAVRKLVAAGGPGSPFPPRVVAAAKAEIGKLAAARNKAVLKVLAEDD